MKRFAKTCVILFALGVSGCVPIQELDVPDVELCFELTRDTAFCKTTNSNIERDIPAVEWIEMRKQRTSLSVDDYKALVKFIEETCETFKCTDEKKKQIQTLKLKPIYE